MSFAGGLENAVDEAAVTSFRRQLARQLREDSAGASASFCLRPPASSMSAAELMAVLLDGHLRFDVANPRDPRRDHLIFSNGRAWALYYAMLKAAGAIRDEESAGFRKSGSWPEGHSSQGTFPTDVATGSMGKGLPVGIGIGVALAGKYLDRLPYRVWVLCGDSEIAEDSTWEAFRYGGQARLDNLTVIVDANRLGLAGKIMLGRDLRRARAFGWHAITIDGHDVDAIDQAYQEAAANRSQPTVIFARTLMSRGAETVSDRLGHRGEPSDDPAGRTAGCGGQHRLRVHVAQPETVRRPHRFEACGQELPRWDAGAEVATCEAYSEALAALGHWRGDVVALDGEASGTTRSAPFAQAHPDRHFAMLMAEQQLLAAAVGIQARGWAPFASVFSRTYDFAGLAAISRANLCLASFYADLTIGEDGVSRTVLKDFASLRAVPGSVVLHPSDANQVPPLVAQMADHPGISYMRTIRSKTVVRTRPGEDIRIGGSRLVRGSDQDDVTVVACGVTVGEAEEAARQLERDGMRVRVIDCYSIKPIDTEALRSAARQTAVIVTVEDHWPQGGLGEAVLSALADQPHRPPVLRLAARSMPICGQPADSPQAAGIDAAAIVRAVRTHLATPADAA
jgi:transketolase